MGKWSLGKRLTAGSKRDQSTKERSHCSAGLETKETKSGGVSKDPVLKTCPKQLRHNPQRESRREIERNRERTSGKGRKRESLQPSSENDQAAASTSGRNGSHTHILTVQLCTQCGHWLNGKKRKQEPTAVAATTTTTTTADDVVDEEHTENRHNARPLFPHSHRAPLQHQTTPPVILYSILQTHTRTHTHSSCASCDFTRHFSSAQFLTKFQFELGFASAATTATRLFMLFSMLVPAARRCCCCSCCSCSCCSCSCCQLPVYILLWR